MSRKYNIITKTKYKDFCDKTNDIQTVENDLEIRRVTLIDKFDNKCQIDYNKDDTILALTRVGESDPVYMLYLLATLADAIFLSEVDYKNCIQVPLMNKPVNKIVEITNDTYEEFTKYFKDYIKYARDFDKEYQLLNRKERINSNTISIESDYLDGQNYSYSITKSIEEKPRKTDDYFELDEDFEIEKNVTENQEITPRITLLKT